MHRATFLGSITALLLAGLLYAALRPAEAPSPEPERRPAETAWLQRTFPHYRADPAAYRAAFVEAGRLRAAAKTDPFGPWEPVGPTNVGGRIVDVAFDPQTPTTVYAAAATGGVFKSTDLGQTWAPIFDDQPLLSIGDVAVDPSNPQTLYVGTGEANGGHNNFAGAGLYKSDDGGTTWRFLGLEKTTSIGRVLVDPERPQRVFVAAVGSYFAAHPERGLYRSDDGGETFERVLFVNDSTGVIDVVQRPDDPDVLLAATWERARGPFEATLAGDDSGVWRSDDGGDTWTRLGPADGLPAGPAGRIGLSLSHGHPDVVYALYTDGYRYRGLYRSDDGGRTWRDADTDDEVRAGTRAFSWYFGQVRAHPRDPDVVFVLDVRMSASLDGGGSWRRTDGLEGGGALHVDHHALAFHPSDPRIVIAGNDGGLARSTNGGATWTPLGGLPITQFYEIAADPTDPERFYGGTQDNGVIVSNGPGGWQRILGGDGFYIAVDPTDPATVYAESQNGGLVKFTAEGAASATEGIPRDEPRNWSTPVVMDPQNPQRLYYGTNRIWRTEDGATTWTPISPDLTRRLGLDLIGTVTTIAVAPSDPRVLYAGTDDGYVWVSEDDGATWRNVTRAPLPFRWVTRLAVDPTDPRTAYATYSGLKWRDPEPHVFRTRDAGATWDDVTANLPDAPVNAFTIDTLDPRVLYLGSDVGAFVSLDAGGTWQPLGTGLPAVSVYDLTLYDDGTRRFLLAGTHGRSMYRLPLGFAPVATEPDAVPDGVVLQAAFPNPFRDRATLSFRLAAPASVRLEIFDVRGRKVATLADGAHAAGTHTATWTPALAAPGLYLARLTVADAAGRTVRTTTLTRLR
ncbi:MAG: T9SS type A sorting domain-containing protein [Rhodothermales bacterium]|nr:T9SS type A sorting domain-containing protein [Rhodothermales bacterium]